MSTTPQVKQTIAGWLQIGQTLVAIGITSVEILDRTPVYDRDPISPDGAYFWNFGWRWLAPDEPSSLWTLPEAIFRHLPRCSFPEVEAARQAGRGVAPRWPTKEAAMEALHVAVMAWARPQAEGREGGS